MEERRQWDLPSLKGVHRIEAGLENTCYDVKFYPYTAPGEGSIFAVVGDKLITVFRIASNGSLGVLQAIEDNKEDTKYYSCAWTRDPKTGNPLLCVGGYSSLINIIDVLTGKVMRTLVGHGGPVNDLVISPLNPLILASASDDTTVRIWSLKDEYEKHPCAVICAGEGHRDPIQSIAFHSNGRYILSSGVDHIINLWGVPILPDSKTGTETATLIHYPLFLTSQIHSNIVDCVCWHGDLILSKAFNEDCIVLWKITGFSSDLPIPKSSSAPTTHNDHNYYADTRSAFAPALPQDRVRGTYLSQYERLLQFSIPGCCSFYMRFGFLHSSADGTAHPVLMLGNSEAKVFFWDFARLDAYDDYISSVSEANPQSLSTARDLDPSDMIGGPRRPPWLQQLKPSKGKGRLRDVRETSPNPSMRSSSMNTTGTDSSDTPTTLTRAEYAQSKRIWDMKYGIGDPLAMLMAHKTVQVVRVGFTVRQCAWSIGGEWCVVVGTEGIVAVFGRWGATAVAKANSKVGISGDKI